MDDIKLEIKGFGSINEANIELNKINVVGGINSSGKSTVARLLYCYLKADALNDEEYIGKLLFDKLEMIDGGVTLSQDISLSDMIDEYEYCFPQDDDVDSLVDLLYQDKQISYTSILRDLIVKENLDSFKGYSKLYNSNFTSIFGNDFNKKEYDEGFVEVRSKLRKSENKEELDNLFDDDDDYLDDFLVCHFDYDGYGPDMPYDDYQEDYALRELEDDIALGYRLYAYKTKGSLNVFNDVFYIDSLSILDLLEFINSEKNDAENIFPKDHIRYLLDSLSDVDDSSWEYDFRHYGSNALEYGEFDKKTEHILEEIFKIIDGTLSSGKNDAYYSFDDYVVKYVGTGNIASGIKQIGIVQLLVLKGKLKDNSFLIVDEPEVNLHPYWQFKFAEILVMLVKELDITIYINSHSPMFIESIDALTEFYDMQDDISYYLTEKLNKDKFNFIKINHDELYEIYDSLGKPFGLIDQLRLRKHLGD